MRIAKQDKDIDIVYQSGTSLGHLLETRLYVMKFLDISNQDNKDLVDKQLALLKESLTSLNNQVSGSKKKLVRECLEYTQMYSDSFNSLTDAVFARNDLVLNKLDVIGPTIANNEEKIKLDYKARQDALGPVLQANTEKSVYTILIASLLAFLLGITLAVIIARGIIKPVNKVKDAANAISKGDLSTRIDLEQNDEIGQLAKAFREMSDSLNEKADVAENISNGNLDVAVRIASDKDKLGKSMQRMIDSIKKVNVDIAEITTAAGRGAAGETLRFLSPQGSLHKLVSGINNLLDSIVNPIRESADVLSRAARKRHDRQSTRPVQRPTGGIQQQFSIPLSILSTMLSDRYRVR